MAELSLLKYCNAGCFIDRCPSFERKAQSSGIFAEVSGVVTERIDASA